MARIGIYGGTFDPVHVGHIAVARQALDAFRLAKMLLIPAKDPWLKRGERISQFHHRYRMLEIAIQGQSGFAVAQIEGLRDGLTYTIDTVEQLVAENSSDEFLLVIGQDSLETMPRWQRIKELLELCPLAVYRRGGQNTTEAERAIAALGGRVSWMDGPLVDVSATKLREDIALGGAPEDRMPPGVYEYIQLHRLYGAMDSK